MVALGCVIHSLTRIRRRKIFTNQLLKRRSKKMSEQITPVSAFHSIILDGKPGEGKSTVIKPIVETLEEIYKEKNVIILLNGQPLHVVVEKVIKKDAPGRMQYIEAIYTPSVKINEFHQAMSIGYTLVGAEMDLRERYPVYENNKDLPKVINVVERNSACAGAIFIASSFYNMRENSDVKERAANYYDNSWDKVVCIRDRMLALAKRCLKHATSHTVLILQGSAELCFKKMMNRGRKFEAGGLTYDYMEKLDMIHRIYGGERETDGRVVPACQVYPMDKTAIFNVPTDPYYCQEEYDREMMIGELVERMMNHINEDLDRRGFN